MELAVAVFVLIVVGATLAGVVAGGLVVRWRAGRRNQQAARTEERAAVLKTELDATRRAKRREKNKSDRLQSELADAATEIERLETALAEAARQVDGQADDVAVASRKLQEFQTRFSDIVGLEADIATLRVIAARVPELERRLAEYESNDSEVIDLRERRPH
jgi:chromosome segregation ATPase